MEKLRGRTGTAARGLEFQILTAAWPGEVLGATWDEFDLKQGIWTIAGDRMKSGSEHRVPLSKSAKSVLLKLSEPSDSKFVFPGQTEGQPLSNMAFLQLLKRMGYGHVTAHGFRSTFRDWTAERTNHSREAAEAALAHAIGNKVEAAYRRGDLFEKRRRLMEDWAEFCSAPQPVHGEVIPIGGRSV